MLKLLLHPIRYIGEDDLEPARLGEQRHLPEREHARCVHTGDAAQIDQEEPDRPGFRPLAYPLQESAGRPEEHEPVQAEDLDTVDEALQGDAFAGWAVYVAAERGPERDLSHQVDPTVVDREQHDRQDQPHLESGQEPLRGYREHDREDDQVLAHWQRVPHVDDPHHQERQADEYQHAPHEHPRDQSHERSAEEDGRERDEGGHEACAPPVGLHLLGQR